MKRYRIKITERDFKQLKTEVFVNSPLERGAFALAGISSHNNVVDILIRRVIPIPQDKFDFQSEVRLEINSKAISGLGSLSVENGLTLGVCHSHAADTPYSQSDFFGETRIFSTLAAFVPDAAPLVSLLITPNCVDGRVWLPKEKKFYPISEVIVIGRSVQKVTTGFHRVEDSRAIPKIFDRQVRAFGKEGQQVIRASKVAVVGLGGTGSPTAEQLVRLGVQDLVIIDHDIFESSNITRMFGAFAKAQRRHLPRIFGSRTNLHKVDILQKHLVSINPKLEIKGIVAKAHIREAGLALLDRDVIFICTDDHWGRSVVNQIAYQYMIPAINIGVRIDSENGRVSHAGGSLDIIRPDEPCLWCQNILDATRIAAESLPKEQRLGLLREGYVEDIDTPTPSVISFTTTLSGLAVSYFLQLITDFMGESGNVKSLRYNIMTGEVRRCGAVHKENCICLQNKGFGDLKPLYLIG